jgi:hypothetical protein
VSPPGQAHLPAGVFPGGRDSSCRLFSWKGAHPVSR